MYLLPAPKNPILSSSTFRVQFPAVSPFIRGSFKNFAEYVTFSEIQNSTIIEATFPSKWSPCANVCSISDYKSVREVPGSHSVKDFSAILSHKCRPFNADFSQGNR